jgi:hypothetical protein
MKKYKNIYSEEIQKNNWSEKKIMNAHKMARNWLRRFKNIRIEI